MRCWTPRPDETPALAWYDPLVAVSRRARDREPMWPVFVDEFGLVGRVDRPRRPSVSVYRHVVTGGVLLADADGTTYEVGELASDRTPRRFDEIPLTTALTRCGVHPYGEAPVDEPPERHLRLVRGGAA